MSSKAKIILTVLFIAFLVANIFATQYIASVLNYQPALDWCLHKGDNYKIYMPFAWLFWWSKFGTVDNKWLFDHYGLTPLLVIMTGVIACLALYKLCKKPDLSDNHGTAHFATLEEIEATSKIDPPGLLSGKGVILGVLDDGKLIRDDTKTHVLVCAPTRSGKGVGIIIPTLLTWEDSVVVTDIKGENWELTAKWRKEKMNNLVFKFEPTEEFSSKFNPFDEIRIRTKYEVRDIQNIIKILTDPTGQGSEGNNAHWINNAAALLTGVVLHLKYQKENANMYDILNFLYGDRESTTRKDKSKNSSSDEVHVSDDEPYMYLADDNSDEDEDFQTQAISDEEREQLKQSEKENNISVDDEDDDEEDDDSSSYDDYSELSGLQKKMADFIKDPNAKHDETGDIFKELYPSIAIGKKHPMVMQYFQSMVDKPAKEFGSILSTLDTVLNTYRDPIIAKNMEYSDFRIKDVMNHEKPISLYLVFPPSDLDRVKPVFRIIIEMLYRLNTETMKFENGVKIDTKHRMLLLLDEFPALGKLETIERAMAFIAGYGIKAMIITQDINQIEKLYTVSNSIVSNCQVQVYHTPTDNKTPEFISKKMGNHTVQASSTNMGHAVVNIHRSYSLSETGRPLMTPDEVNTMDKKKELIFLAGVRPIYCNKIRFYEVDYFSKRTKIGTVAADEMSSLYAIDVKATSQPKSLEKAEVKNNERTTNRQGRFGFKTASKTPQQGEANPNDVGPRICDNQRSETAEIESDCGKSSVVNENQSTDGELKAGGSINREPSKETTDPSEQIETTNNFDEIFSTQKKEILSSDDNNKSDSESDPSLGAIDVIDVNSITPDSLDFKNND